MIENNRVHPPYKGVIRVIDWALVEELRTDAERSSRRRAVYRFHDYSEHVQRMINFLFRDTYVQPHKHENPNKIEGFLVLFGELGVVIFNDKGEVIETCLLGEFHNRIYADIPPATWHTVVSLSSETLIFEIKDGPYDSNTDKIFPTWAPQEGSKGAVEYLAELRRKLRF